MKLAVFIIAAVGWSQTVAVPGPGIGPFASSTVATPTDSPGAGTYGSTQSVTLADATSGSTICYTIDGSTPGASTPGTCNSSPTTTYSGAISVASTTTVKAIGTKAALTNSGVLTSVYTIGPSYLFYGPGCAGTSTNTCTVGGTTQSGITGYTLGASFTTGSNAHGYDVVSCSQYMTARDGTDPQINCAIYSDDLFTAATVCIATSEITPTSGAGWKENTNFTSCHLAPSTTYVITFQNKGSGNTVVYDTASEAYSYLASTYGTWPSGNWNNSTAVRSQMIKVTATP